MNVAHLSSMHGDTSAGESSEVTPQDSAELSSPGTLKTTPTGSPMSSSSTQQPQSVVKRLSVDVHRQSIEKTPHDGMTNIILLLTSL